MNKLIKQVEFGEMSFKVGINRDITIKVFEEFPDFVSRVLDIKGGTDIKVAIKQKKTREIFELGDYITQSLKDVIPFALPLLLAEANDNSNSKDIIKYAIENDADELFNMEMWQFILVGFTEGGKQKQPKVSFKMK